MPDVREVFQMSTQKVRPDRGFVERQGFRQRRRVRTRKIGAFALAAAIVATAAFAVIELAPGDPEVPVDTGTQTPAAPVGAGVTNWYLDIVSGERTPLAEDLSDARLLDVSPNGEAVAYNTCCEDDAIYLAQLDGSGIEMITPENLDGYGPTWIDDEKILFQGRPEGSTQLGELYVADLTTGDVTMVVDMPYEVNGWWIVISDVSPDGTTVLFHFPRGKGNNVKWDLWTTPLDGGEPTLLRQDAGFARYAADGSIVFLDHPIPTEGDAIWIMRDDGSNARPLVGEPGETFAWPRVSPDGTKVAYSHDRTVEWVDLETGEVTTTDELNDEPVWYGDDTLIV